jgi:hypothetical protein
MRMKADGHSPLVSTIRWSDCIRARDLDYGLALT